jgi:hypothetical protein
MIAAMLLAMMNVPPPGWQPPHVAGPGLLCGDAFGVDLLAGESATYDWPGEVFMNDLFGTIHVVTPRGEVIVTENGERTRPQGPWHGAGRVDGRALRDHGQGVYSVEVATSGNIRAITLRFGSGFAPTDQAAVLGRLHIDPPPHPVCLAPDNRPRPPEGEQIR